MPTQDLETLAGQAEIAVLESWWGHELRCKSPHAPSSIGRNDSGCTVTATHRITHGSGSHLICQSRADFLASQIARGVACNRCGKPASECWQIVAV